MKSPGELALVLHTHMPLVALGPWPPGKYSNVPNPLGFGTWPFGEEWLWEAIATCYLPLLRVLGRAPLTLSLTPVLCDQLEAPGALARCLSFLREVRPESHRLDEEEFRPLRRLVSGDGPVLWPIDRQTMALVWSDGGYPADAAYRDRHRLTTHHHRVWRNDGRPYDRQAARAVARRHAQDFVARVLQRVRDGGVCVCAVDTELLGHWWHEGIDWLEAVIDEAARQGLALTTLDDALPRHEP